ncbi:CPBP family intramembrane glutamic endopeptidase [Pseudomonas putida]|uniref:CPBP family intramembrane metalloprotease n=1 Tax=Pseudomonas putida TaxID=303 RepID=A0A8I1JJH2_PSEPU|nr:type II CAAX endopeptidase family protein [Pseudomonas putida]MBI6882370.1 CPBP family intramembrane metalloprotease [Pseudomonas putida]
MTALAYPASSPSTKKFLACTFLATLSGFLGQVAGAALAIFVLGGQYVLPMAMTLGLMALLVSLKMMSPSGIKIPLLGENFTLIKMSWWIVLYVVMLKLHGMYADASGASSEAALTEMARGFKESGLFLKVAIIASTALFAPVFEEIIFRQLIIQAYPAHLGRVWVWVAGVSSVVLFTLGHVQYFKVSTFVFIACYAIMLTVARLHTGGVLTPIVMHVLNNSAACYAMATYSPDTL